MSLRKMIQVNRKHQSIPFSVLYNNGLTLQYEKTSYRGRKWRKTAFFGCHLGFFQYGGLMPHFQQFHLVPFHTCSPLRPLHIPIAKPRRACNVYGGIWQGQDYLKHLGSSRVWPLARARANHSAKAAACRWLSRLPS